MIEFLSIIYMLAVAGLSLYGFLGLLTLRLYWRHRHDEFMLPDVSHIDLPPVTVQLPIYNERFVVDRLISAAASLNYPPDRLQIQVLDDSTDDTTHKAAELVAFYRSSGVNISLRHRTHRQGYKAGALAEATAEASGEYLAIFDADFQPPPDFLRQTIPHFVNDPHLGMVQTRWEHLNRGDSPLTAAQAIAIDKHFAMEQLVRHRASLYPKFNGAGGVWRSDCLREAGGWEADTVCEDLCLSTRAILSGWQFRFLDKVTAPAELPTTISAYKNQQARWAKGSIQCLVKYGRAILGDKQQSLFARWYALISMSAYATHLLMLTMLLIQVPLLYSDYRFSSSMAVFSLFGIGQPVLFVLGQQTLYADWRRRLRHFPTLLLVAIGMAPSNSRAILEATSRKDHPFVRTPKGGKMSNGEAYRMTFDWIILVELFLMLYAVVGLGIALNARNYGPVFFLAACGLGFGYVSFLGVREAVRK